MKLTSAFTVVFVLHITTSVKLVQGTTCSDCKSVASPDHCHQTSVCQAGEICFTEEDKDGTGKQIFRLGCSDKATCTKNTQTPFGKRDAQDAAPPDRCYLCCTTDQCNSRLCHDAVMASTSHQNVCTTGNACPHMFVAFKDNCYLFAPEYTSWANARHYCRTQGAELLSVISKEENNFLVQELNYLKALDTSSFWTSGVYSHTTKQLEWMDGSPLNYTNWHTGQPPSSYSRSTDYYVMIANPAGTSVYKTAPMWVYDGFNNNGVICKRQRS